jgi:hypothetical protein
MINWKYKMSLRGYNRLKLIKTNKGIVIELSCNLNSCNEFSYLLFQEKRNDKFKKLSVMWSLKRHQLQRKPATIERFININFIVPDLF